MNNTLQWFSTTPNTKWEHCAIEGSLTPAGSDATLELTNTRHQTLDGFGGCFNELGWIALSKLSQEQRDIILDDLFLNASGCKFNFSRLPIGANDYAEKWYSHNETENDFEMKYFSIEQDHKYLLPYIKEGLKRQPDMKLFASPWSPPTWMKFPKSYNYGTLVWEPKYLDAYALYFLKFIQEYKKEGITINQIHVQNEPAHDQKFPSCLWTGDQFREFIGCYLGPLFERNGIDASIWLGTINAPEMDDRRLYTDYDHYANLVLSDPIARRYIEGVSYQWAGKHTIQRTHESWPEIKLIQSENECGDGKNTWEYAHYIFTLFRHYFANGANAYVYWNMILEEGGRSTWGWNQNSLISINPATQEVTYNPEYYVMKHFSHFLSPGAVRIGTKGHFTGNSIAFENPDGSYVIIINNSMKQERELNLLCNKNTYTMHLKPNSINTFLLKE